MFSECIILAGGLGTRLKGVINEIPKVLAPVNGNPFLHYHIEHLKKNKINKYILSVGYKKEMIIDFILKNERKGQFILAEEDEPLGTGGGIKNALQHTDSDHVLVINGDSFFNIRYHDLYKNHLKKNTLCSVALKPMQNYDRYGSVQINTENKITAFMEKKKQEKGFINAGVYILNRNEFLTIKLNQKFSFEKDFLEKYFNQFLIYGFPFNDYFIDIGIPEDYKKAQIDFKNKID